tara:strand:- start:42 stop:179 length:138 start_codon:yes stop_codon:yes gene_type:complete
MDCLEHIKVSVSDANNLEASAHYVPYSISANLWTDEPGDRIHEAQ